MAWRVYDIDLYGLFGKRIDDADGRVLGQDRNAAFAFQVVGIHHALGHLLVVAECMCLAQQEVNQRCFPMVNMGNNGNVSEVCSFD